MNLVGYGGRCSKAQDCPTPPGADRGVCRSHYCQTGKQGASCGHSGDCVPPKGRNHGVCRDGKCQDPCRNQPPRGSDPRHGPRTIRVVVMASPRPVHAISPRGRTIAASVASPRAGPSSINSGFPTGQDGGLSGPSLCGRTEDCAPLALLAGRNYYDAVVDFSGPDHAVCRGGECQDGGSGSSCGVHQDCISRGCWGGKCQ